MRRKQAGTDAPQERGVETARQAGESESLTPIEQNAAGQDRERIQRLLLAIRPHLRVKRRQADLVLKMMDMQRSERGEIEAEVKRLNQRFPLPGSVALEAMAP